MLITVQFEMADTNEVGEVISVLRMETLLYNHLCLALGDGDPTSQDWLIGQTVGIKIVNQEE